MICNEEEADGRARVTTDEEREQRLSCVGSPAENGCDMRQETKLSLARRADHTASQYSGNYCC